MPALIAILVDVLIGVLIVICSGLGVDVQKHSNDINAIAGTLALAIVTGGGALGLWIWRVLQNSKVWKQAKALADAPSDPPAAPGSGSLALLLVALLLPAGLTGCSAATRTPNEQFNAAAIRHDLLVVGISAAQAANKIPAAMQPQIEAGEKAAVKQFADAQAWLDANPQLADVPGYRLPVPLTPTLNVLAQFVPTYLFSGRLVPLRPSPAIPAPATPATTQP